MELGVYIHYPWCRSRCPYCDFAIAVAPLEEIPHRAYLRAILTELAARADDYPDRRLRSIYFGGGTPSLWPADCLAEAIAQVRARFPAVGALEVTLEANPVDCTAEVMASWRTAGITRLSIGAQSFDAGELVTLGRDHHMGEGRAAIAAAVGAGFVSLSADFILGVPGQRAAPGAATDAAQAGVPHLSIYELTIEPGTPLAARVGRGELLPRDDDELASAYAEVDARLGAAGYEHYEISSYARPGHRAVHNALYWQVADYLGLGNGAHSLRLGNDGGQRSSNPRSVKTYLGAGPGRPIEHHELSGDELRCEAVWLGLRTSEGVGESALAGYPTLVSWLEDAGLARRSDGRIRPTLRGFLLWGQVARRVVEAFGYPSTGARV